MARTLTAPAAAQAARRDGPRPVHILEIAFTGGTVFWSDMDLTSPVTAEGRVVQWGELQLEAVPGKAGGVGTLNITVRDDDLYLLQAAETQPGFQKVDATLYLWFAGTTWPDDRLVLFAGTLTAPGEWSEEHATYKLTMKGRENLYDPSIGYMMQQTAFPEIDCKSCENEIVPIVYGNPCARVPCCVVDRPGVAQLASQLTSLPPSTTLTIDKGAADANFTQAGTAIELVIGWPGRWERITGSFASSDDTTFSITARGSVYADGLLQGFYAKGGIQYMVIDEADLPDGGATNRAGYIMLLKDSTNVWHAFVVTHWSDLSVGGTGGRVVGIRPQLDGANIASNASWQILSEPGTIPVWPAGTPVNEAGLANTSQLGGSWTYIANFLPSKSVDSVEIRARINVQGGDSRVAWARIDPSYYSVNLNDTTYNSNLGREPSDPGCTTITLSFSPTSLGSDSETIFATIKGITDTNAPSGTVIEDPALVCQNLLMNEFLGNIPASRVDTGSFTAAAALVTTRCSFALMDEKRSLNELVSDIAYQAGCVFFWDGGKATIKKIKSTILLSDSQFTINDSTRKARSLKVSEIDVKEYVTEMIGKYRRTVPDNEQRLVRGSEAAREDSSGNASSAGGNAAKTDFGLQRDEIDFWAFQFPTSVALATEEWLKYRLTVNRLVTCEVFLDALKLQPADVVTLNIQNGLGTYLFQNIPARVRSLRMRLGSAVRREMPTITVVAEVQLYDYGITVIVPDDNGCAGQNSSGGRSRSTKLAVRSTGQSRSLFVQQPDIVGIDTGAAGGSHNLDPTVDLVGGAETPELMPGVDPSAPFSSFGASA